MTKLQSDSDFFGKEKIGKILFKITPPVMLAQLIQALYNIVDSFFVGKFSNDGLTALSVIFPIQLIIIAFAVGNGVGVNTYMARKDAMGQNCEADEAAGTGALLALLSWAIFAILSLLLMRPFATLSASSKTAVEYAVTYGRITCVGSLFTFLEGNFTKVHQARGNMVRPMVAQIIGAAVNILLDPILIFGVGPIHGMGIAGAAIATVTGQLSSAIITAFGALKPIPPLKKAMRYIGRIYFYGYSYMVMHSLYTVYIMVLNIILAGFSDAAVTVLGLYYKLQTFFFIPLFGLQTCIVPVLSYNYARKNFDRCKQTLRQSILVSALFMCIGVAGFLFAPRALIGLFSDSAEVLSIGSGAFPLIGCSFIPAVFSLMTPVFFQAIGMGAKSTMLSLTRQIFCLIPTFWLYSLIGLEYCWLAFPTSEMIAGSIGIAMYLATTKRWRACEADLD